MANKPPMVYVGQVLGLDIFATPSRKSALELIKAEAGDGEHISLCTEDDTKWSERQDIVASHLLVLWEETWKFREEEMERIIPQLYPHYATLCLDALAYRVLGNHEDAAVRDNIHAHILVARKIIWASNIVPRIVSPYTPVPLKDRMKT